MQLRQSISLCAILAIAALRVGGRSALAAPIDPTYFELGNSGTQITTDFANPPQTTLNLNAPYGTHVINSVSGGWEIQFFPTSQFQALATGNDNGGVRVETDGKVTFTLTFATPIQLAASIVEGGQYHTSGAGSLSTVAGGIIIETVDSLGNRKSIGGTSNLATYNDDGSWTSTIDLGGFVNSYTTYKFSIDNYLRADALGPGEAFISKDTFKIIIPSPGGEPNPAPLPLAAVGGSALSGLLLLFRKRLARSIA